MKFRDPETGGFKELYTKAADTLPVGTEVDYDGTEVPAGWEEVDAPNNYSTEEQLIGTWLGKPLYRKTIKFTATILSGETYERTHNISNVDFIKIKEFALVSQSGLSYVLPIIGYNGNITEKLYAYVDRNTIYVAGNSSYADGWTKIVTLEYTKTID